ncbi:MAG TPA: proline dehydrogenase family protein [Vicinamibacterales bacterium]|nr:proline dehydrogenase family protein [Vicinamibacterales bacterium]
MLDATSKAFFHSLAQIRFLKRAASRYGMARGTGFARRFIAGESIDEAVVAVQGVAAQGLLLTLDYLGESVRTTAEADAATRDCLRILDTIVRSGIERNISLKLTQLGLDVDRATCVDNLRRILDPATEHGFFVRIDMENSPYTDVTLQVFETLWGQEYRNIGVVLQSYLLRTEADIRRINALGARIRLVKGAYREPKAVAYQKKSEVDEAFVRLMQLLLDESTYPAIATHDPNMLEATKAYAAEKGYARNRFEFQMLYGIRRDLQTSLAAEGYPMRIYIPFGEQWFAYFMRRLGERPANIGFVLKGMLRER